MGIFKIVCALSAITMMCGAVESAPKEAAPTLDLSWEMTPIDNGLTPKQIVFLNIYMNHSDAKEMKGLPKHVKENLPLYIALYQRQLDPNAVNRFRAAQLLDVGLSFDDIVTLQSIMGNIRQGMPVSAEQNDFLYDFIKKDIKENKRIALNPWIQPLFSYVKNNPEEFTPKIENILRDSLLSSVGLKEKDLNTLYAFADKKSNTPVLEDKEIRALNRLMLLAYLQGVDILDSEKINYLQFVVNQNAGIFNPQKVASFNQIIANSQNVQKFRYNTFKENVSNKQVEDLKASQPVNSQGFDQQQAEYARQVAQQQQLARQQRGPEQQYYDQQQVEYARQIAYQQQLARQQQVARQQAVTEQRQAQAAQQQYYDQEQVQNIQQ